MVNAHHTQSWLYQMVSKVPSMFHVLRLVPNVTLTFLGAFLHGHPIYLCYWLWVLPQYLFMFLFPGTKLLF